MLRKLKFDGVEVATVHFKNWLNGKDEAVIEIHTIKYNKILLQTEYTSDPTIAKIFLTETEKIYNKIINNE